MKTTVYSRAGVAKYEAGNLEFHDSWMGEEYVTFSLESPYPINIEIGDYLVYRGHTYSAYNVPSALKQARRNSYGAAFKYDNVKFSSRSAEMADTDMHDIVLYDNNIHYTSLPKFSVYCETFDDLLDRLQANMNRNGGWQWIFLSPNFQRVSQRYPLDNPLREEAIRLWEQYYGSDHDNPTADTSKEKRGVNISFDNNSVWDALGKVHEVFGVNYLCYDRVVVVGAGGVPADKIFRYGKGNGLATIERIADNDQKVVTRLFAYGSNKNLPLRYYSDLAWKPFMTVTYKEDMSEYDDPIYFRVQLDMPWAIGTYKEPHPSWHNATLQQDLIGGWAPVVVSLDMKTPIAYTNPYSGERNSILTCDMVEHNLYQQFVKGQARLNGLPMELYDTIEVGTRIYFLDGVYRESFNDQHRGYDLAELPNNMAVDFLMLPGFPKYSLNELCRCVEENGKTLYQIRKDTDTQNYSTFLEVDGSYPITFSTDKLKPYIQSQNAATLGIKEGNIFFDEENDDNGLKEVYPSIEEMTVGDVYGTQSTERLDELADAQIVEDNGVFEEGKEVSNVWVALKDLGFNLQWAINNSTGDAQISFKDGYCSGRTFSIKGVSQNEDGTWKVSLQREVDNSVHLYFPYSSAAARGGEPSSDEAYQLQAGDHFVLTGISLSDTSYVWAASVRALRKAIVWLLANDYTRFTYRPAVDEIFMQRQHDAAISGTETIEYGSVSLHDTLKAGMLILFEDDDLDVDGSLFIDSLTIKEGGNNGIPTYDVVLREEKQVGTLQKFQNEVNSVSSSVMSGAGGLSIPQVEGLIKTYGKEWFLSRVADDVAQGFIGFVKGLWVKTRGLFGIDEEGNAKVKSLTVNEDYGIDEDGDITSNSIKKGTGNNITWQVNGSGDAILRDINSRHIVTDSLTAQEAHFFNLIIDEAKSAGGQIVVSPANAELVLVTNSGTDYTCYFKAKDSEGNAIDNQWAVNDLALHMEFNVASASTRNYWARVKAVGTTNAAVGDYAAGDLHYIVLSYASGDYKVNQDYPVKYPQAGDYVVVMGNTSDDSRRNAIVISAYNIPFIDNDPFNGYVAGVLPPLFVEYMNISSFSIDDANRRNVIARNGTRLKGNFEVLNNNTYTDIKTYVSNTSLSVANNAITATVSSGVLKNSTTGIGGRNLIVNGDMEVWQNNVPKWFAAVNNTQSGATTFTKVTSNLPSGFSTGVAVVCQYSYDGLACGTWGVPPQPNFPIVSGKGYTFSFYVKTENGSRLYVELDTAVSNIPTTSEWERKSFTFTATDEDDKNIRITILCMSADTMYLTGLQIEEGDIMTAWKPAKEDTDNAFSNVDMAISDINDTTNVLEGDVEEISGRDNANVIPQSTFPYGQDSAKKWWSSLGSRARTSDGESAGVNYWMQEDATCGVSSDSTMGACLYAKEIFPSDYIYYDVIAKKTLVTSAGVENLVLEHGAWYTLSWWQKRVSGASVDFIAYWLHDKAEQIYIDGVASESWKNVDYFAPSYSDTDEWVRHTVTFKTRAAWASGETISINWRLYLLATTSAQTPTEYWLTRVQLEKGKVATDWKPNPDDLDERIDINATNIAQVNSSTELRLAQLEASLLVMQNDLVRAGVILNGAQSRIALIANKVTFETVNGRVYIQTGVDSQGYPMLQFLDPNGRVAYDLGYTGLTQIIEQSVAHKFNTYELFGYNYVSSNWKGIDENVNVLAKYLWAFGGQGDADDPLPHRTPYDTKTTYEYYSGYTLNQQGDKIYTHYDYQPNLYLSNSVDSSTAPTGTPIGDGWLAVLVGDNTRTNYDSIGGFSYITGTKVFELRYVKTVAVGDIASPTYKHRFYGYTMRVSVLKEVSIWYDFDERTGESTYGGRNTYYTATILDSIEGYTPSTDKSYVKMPPIPTSDAEADSDGEEEEIAEE